MEFIKDPSKMIIAFLLFMLTFIGGWQASSYSAAENTKNITDAEVQRLVGPQLAAMNQKLNDIQFELAQIGQYTVRKSEQ